MDPALYPPDVGSRSELTEPLDQPVDFDYDLLPAFDVGAWEPVAYRYGLIGLLRLREAMMPIQKPPEMQHLKFLVGHFHDANFDQDGDGPEPHPGEERKGKGKGKGKGKSKDKDGHKGGRYVPDMGKTELMPDFHQGQWWRNVASDQGDVIVREQFSLASPEVFVVPFGYYVQQAGPVEVFINGQAAGLQRMPVLPRGWATVDATTVGGPKYLEKVRVPRWRIIFSSGSNKGDIVVREAVSLESEEVAVLMCGAIVDQSGPQQVLGDGIIRMPITFGKGAIGPRPNSFSGWVTCDASAQGGPRFFEPCPVELETPAQQPGAQPSPQQPQQAEDEGGGGGGADRSSGPSWEKNRIWKVANISQNYGGRQLAMVNRPEPFAPGSGKSPPEGFLVRWLVDNDIVEQVGHSKKMRGFMVMPVRIVSLADGSDVAALSDDPGKVEGWVTRRSLDKTRDNPDSAWFEEMRGDDDTDRQSRRSRRQQQEAPRLD